MLSSEDCILALFVGFEVVWDVFEELDEDIEVAACNDEKVVWFLLSLVLQTEE